MASKGPIYKGWLHQKEGTISKTWKNRYYEYTTEGLHGYSSAPSTMEEYELKKRLKKAKCSVSLSLCIGLDVVDGGKDGEFQFKIVCSHKTYYFKAPSDFERSKWVEHLSPLANAGQRAAVLDLGAEHAYGYSHNSSSSS